MVWKRAHKGDDMPTTKAVYEKVKRAVEKKRGTVRECCRSVASLLHLQEEDVEVTVASKNSRWYKELGYEVDEKI